MAKTITITYTAIAAPAAKPIVPQICDIFVPDNNASRQAAFAGTYYDTNVAGFGEATPIEAYMKQMVAHPGLVAALRAAVRALEVAQAEDPEATEGVYTYTEATELDALYAEEVAPALEKNGFTIEVADAEDGGEG